MFARYHGGGEHLMVSDVAYELLGKTHLAFEGINPMA